MERKQKKTGIMQIDNWTMPRQKIDSIKNRKTKWAKKRDKGN